jgi:hypothetical protein
MPDDETIKAVRWRFRICSYLFNVAAVWIAVGFAVIIISSLYELGVPGLTVELIGLGLFSAAFALTLAIYRCPVCDRYLSRFRPDKQKCAHCGATVR